MSQQTPHKKPGQESDGEPAENKPKDDSPTPGKPAPKALTAEEQMDQFEKDLKENDWGHQPC